MAEAARLRGPDIILRTAPPLSATVDNPLGEVPKPPASASNDPADLAAGIPGEMSPEERAAAVADKKETGPDKLETSEERNKPKPDNEVDVSDLPKETPSWAVREITKARKQAREAVARAAEDAKKAVDTASEQAKAAKEAADAAAKELAELKAAQAKAAEPAKPVEPAQTDPRPTRDQFDDPESYDEALTNWATREGERKAADKIAQERAEAEAKAKEAADAAAKAEGEATVARLTAEWTTKTTAAAEKYPDYKEVAEGDHTVSPIMAQALFFADNGPDIAYYLGKNPDESARIATMPPAAQMIQIGMIAAKLSSPPARAPRPRPLDPIDGGTAPADLSDREPTMEEVAQRVNSRYAANRRPFISAEPARRH